MPKAWIEREAIRDICNWGDPFEFFHPDVAKLYDTDVPDTAEKGMIQIDGAWGFPAPPEAPPVQQDETVAPNVAG
jgi:hypothetical protein